MRDELDFQNILVKELSVRTGIPLATLESYLRTQSTEPSAENAVKIALSLGVSTEYLVTGQFMEPNRTYSSLSHENRLIIRRLGDLTGKQRRAILFLIGAFSGK